MGALMNIKNTRPLEGFDGLQEADIEFEVPDPAPAAILHPNDDVRTKTVTRTVVFDDFVWGLHCLLDQGATSKPHAGCFFQDMRDHPSDRDDIHVTIGRHGFSIEREEAQRIVEEHL